MARRQLKSEQVRTEERTGLQGAQLAREKRDLRTLNEPKRPGLFRERREAALNQGAPRTGSPDVATPAVPVVEGPRQPSPFERADKQFAGEVKASEQLIKQRQEEQQLGVRQESRRQQQLRGAISGLKDPLELEKGQRLLRSQAAQTRERGFQQALAGTARGTRAGEREVLLQDLQKQQQEAVTAEENARRTFIVKQAEGESRQRLAELAERLDIAKEQRIGLESQISQAAFGIEERELSQQFEQQQLTQKQQFQQTAQVRQQQFDFEKIQFQAQVDADKALVQSGLDLDEIKLEQQELDATSSKLVGKLMRKDGTFVEDAEGNTIDVPRDAEAVAASTGGIALPNGEYGASPLPSGGLRLDVDAGDFGGQCGKFVNDVLGLPKRPFGDTLSQKSSQINSNTPIAGAAVIMDLGNSRANNGERTGHVAYVEKVNLDGSIAIVDSNFGGNELVQRRNVRPGTPEHDSIVGYFVPPNAVTELDVIISQMDSGRITDSDISKAREIAKSEGRLAEFNQRVLDPENKPVSDARATQLRASFGLTQRGLNQLIEQRRAAGFGNADFQSLPAKGVSELTNYREAGRKLEEVKTLWEDFKDKGHSLSNITSKAGRFFDVEDLPFAETDENLRMFRELTAKTGLELAKFMKDISGAAVSEPEFERLKQVQINTDMKDSQFQDILDQAITDYEANAQNLQNQYGFNDLNTMNDAIFNYGRMPRTLETGASYAPFAPDGLMNDPDIVSATEQAGVLDTGLNGSYDRYTQTDSASGGPR